MSRIIAGSAGGQRLRTPAGDRTRPTTDRVREAFFASLAAWLGTADQPADAQLSGVAFLDLFAGSGAIGLEAASRGASPVVLVESDAAVCALIRDNQQRTALGVEVQRAEAAKFLERASQAFDVVWLDPPYPLPDAEINRLLDLITTRGWLAADALVVVERSARSPRPDFGPDVDAWDRRYGETVLYCAQYDQPQPASTSPGAS